MPAACVRLQIVPQPYETTATVCGFELESTPGLRGVDATLAVEA
jgi:hypothetical protein